MAPHLLQGGCSCGRNQYEIVIPVEEDSRTTAQVFVGTSSDIRRAHASALPTLFRFPLPWLRSTTYAYFDDERPSGIKRVFSPISTPHTRRQFCGFCGVSLTYWSEENREESEFISVNLHSLETESLELMEDIGLLPALHDDDGDDRSSAAVAGLSSSSATASGTATQRSGRPWIEEVAEIGPLGRLTRRRGGHTDVAGQIVVEWEVVDVVEGAEGAESPHKRQMIGSGTAGDLPMTSD